MVFNTCETTLFRMLSELIKKCLHENEIPVCWRTATVTPVPKKFLQIPPYCLQFTFLECLGKCNSPPSYAFSERFWPHRLAFLSFKSTLDALATITHFISSALNIKGKEVRICFLDYSYALNWVDGHRLFSSPSQSCVEHSLISLPADYFRNRQQSTRYYDTTSSLVVSTFKVPHNAVFSSFLFSVYVSSIPNHVHKLLIEYADNVAPNMLQSYSSSISNYHSGIITFRMVIWT